MRLADELAAAEARVEAIKRAIRQGPCAEHGHDWQSDGGCNAVCDRAEDGDCGCSVPVNVCTKCGDCDYGDNAAAEEVRTNCRIRRGSIA